VTGLPLGDACIVDAGITVLAGTKISISPEQLAKIQEANPEANLESKSIFKGVELQGLDGVHFRQDSLTGELIARRSTRKVILNDELH